MDVTPERHWLVFLRAHYCYDVDFFVKQQKPIADLFDFPFLSFTVRVIVLLFTFAWASSIKWRHWASVVHGHVACDTFKLARRPRRNRGIRVTDAPSG